MDWLGSESLVTEIALGWPDCLCDTMMSSSAGSVGVPDPGNREQRQKTLDTACLMTAAFAQVMIIFLQDSFKLKFVEYEYQFKMYFTVINTVIVTE